MVAAHPSSHRILVTARVPSDWEDRLIRSASGADVIMASEPEEALSAAPRATIIYGGRITGEILDAARRLEWCHVSSAGVDRIPLHKLRDRNITLTNSRVQASAVADHAMALLLAWARRIPEAVRNQSCKNWERATGRELKRSTMLIVGMGSIGSEVARRAVGFGMKVIGVRKQPQMMSYTQKVITPDEMDEALEEADYVVLACPLTAETRHIIGREELARMPSHSFLVNIGRGSLVDEDALIQALVEGSIAGAGLDVFSQEPLPGNSPLWDLENVVMTPHIGGSRQGGRAESVTFFMENLGRFFSGRPLLNVVDLDAGY